MKVHLKTKKNKKQKNMVKAHLKTSTKRWVKKITISIFVFMYVCVFSLSLHYIFTKFTLYSHYILTNDLLNNYVEISLMLLQ